MARNISVKYKICMSNGLGNQRLSQKKGRGQEHVNLFLYGWKGLATRKHAKYKSWIKRIMDDQNRRTMEASVQRHY